MIRSMFNGSCASASANSTPLSMLLITSATGFAFGSAGVIPIVPLIIRMLLFSSWTACLLVCLAVSSSFGSMLGLCVTSVTRVLVAWSVTSGCQDPASHTLHVVLGLGSCALSLISLPFLLSALSSFSLSLALGWPVGGPFSYTGFTMLCASLVIFITWF